MSESAEFELHRPSEEFAAHMEWQIRTALRRTSRFDEPVAMRAPWWTRVRAAAVLVAAIGLGAGAVLGAQQIRRSREAELVSARQQVQLALAAMRLQSAQEERAELERQFAAGIVTEDERAAAEARLGECQIAVERSEIDASEIAATGREPDDSIAAPVVRGRDLVAERLKLGLRSSESALRAAEAHAERAEALAGAHVIADGELEAARSRKLASQRAIEFALQRIELRSNFVRGALDPKRAQLLELQLELTRSRDARALEEQSARAALDRLRRLATAGVASGSDLRAAERAAAEARAAIALVELELRLVEEKLRE